MRKTNAVLVLLIFLVLVGGFGAGYFYLELAQTRQKNQSGRQQIEMLKQEIKDLKSALETANKKPAGEAGSKQGNTVVTNPRADDVIKSPVQIAGKARAFENTVNVRVKDAAGKVLKETSFITPGSMGLLNDFAVSMGFAPAGTSKGVIEVFQVSAKDGAEIDKVTIPVVFGKMP